MGLWWLWVFVENIKKLPNVQPRFVRSVRPPPHPRVCRTLALCSRGSRFTGGGAEGELPLFQLPGLHRASVSSPHHRHGLLLLLRHMFSCISSYVLCGHTCPEPSRRVEGRGRPHSSRTLSLRYPRGRKAARERPSGGPVVQSWERCAVGPM